MLCSKCGKELPDKVAFCPSCGTPVEKSFICPACLQKIENDSISYCPNCGISLKERKKLDFSQSGSSTAQSGNNNNTQKSSKAKKILALIGEIGIIIAVLYHCGFFG